MLFVEGGSMPFAKEGTQCIDEGGCCLLRQGGGKEKQ